MGTAGTRNPYIIPGDGQATFIWGARVERHLSDAACHLRGNHRGLDPQAESPSFISLCITPFVPLDRKGNTLAVAPQFPLASAVDENILRKFSYLYPSLFSAQNTLKEEGMMSLLRYSNPGHRVDFSIPVPDGSTEIDFLIEDQATSTVVLAELKWLRNPYKPLERLSARRTWKRG
jgi:hypothetical protein